MIDIKNYLKKIGVSKQDFANEIKLSRPTLDTYINAFENGEIISRDRYQIIFNRLFSEELDEDVFKKRLGEIKNLLNRDERLGTDKLETEAADIVSRINKRILADMSKGDWNKQVYIFVDMLIKDYRKNTTLEKLAEYFSYLNRSKLEDVILDEQIPYFAQFYRAFASLRDNPTLYDKSDFDDFMKRRVEIINDRDKENKIKEENIKGLIVEARKNLEDNGIEVTETEILKALLNKLNK